MDINLDEIETKYCQCQEDSGSFGGWSVVLLKSLLNNILHITWTFTGLRRMSIFIGNRFHNSIKFSYLLKLLPLVVTEVSTRTSSASVTVIWPTWWSLPWCVSPLFLPCGTLSRSCFQTPGKVWNQVKTCFWCLFINELPICNEQLEYQMSYLSKDFSNAVGKDKIIFKIYLKGIRAIAWKDKYTGGTRVASEAVQVTGCSIIEMCIQ